MRRLHSVVLATSSVCALALAVGCGKQDQQGGSAGSTPSASQSAGDVNSRAADEAKIRSLDSSWVKAVAAKNAEQSASYYADDAVLMPPGAPMVAGKDAIQKGWAGMFATPGFGLTFAPDKVIVADGTAHEIGEYEMTTLDKSGKPKTVKGKYVVVWAKQSDGSWKVMVDAPTTTQ